MLLRNAKQSMLYITRFNFDVSTMDSTTTLSCINCNKAVQDALYNTEFLPNLFKIISGFLVLGIIVMVFSYFSFKHYKKRSSLNPDKLFLNPVPLTTTSIILGIGIGGFIDGIFLHQILQWHGMVSNKLPIDTIVGKSVNMFWDGIFHVVTLLAVVVGIASLVRLLKRKNINPSPRLVWGGLFAGWGIFNLVEGLIHHHLLKFHNVNEFSMQQDLWNYGFLASGVLCIAIGFVSIYNRSYYTTRLEE